MKIEIGKRILGLNDQQSLANRRTLDELSLMAVNVLASPGAGKTSVILKLLAGLRARKYSVGVIEGDVASSIDTEKIRRSGYPATQINTDGGCHLTASMVNTAIGELGVKGPGWLFIENIGNLICPTNYHLGENLRLVISSVPEGHDKPVKYPGIFATADLVVLNKIDLLEHVDFDLAEFEQSIRTINPQLPIFKVSCRSGEGMAAVLDWLIKNVVSGKN